MAHDNERADTECFDKLAKVGRKSLEVVRSARARRCAASSQIHRNASRAGSKLGDDVVPHGAIGLPAVNEQESSIARPLFDVGELGAVTRTKTVLRPSTGSG